MATKKTTYGPATGNYSAESIRLAKKANDAKAGDQIINGQHIKNTTSSGTSGGASGVGGVNGGRTPSSPEADYLRDIQKAYEARQKAMQKGLTTQLGEIKQMSDDNRSQTYVNSRISAIGNNERLANQGLAGGLYGNPTSGKSESSRIQQDVALGNNLNAVNRQQSSLEAQARNAVATGLADNQMEMAKTIAQLRQQQAQNERAEFTNTIGAYGQDYMQEILNIQNDGDPSNDWKIPYLQSARNQKISGIEQSKAEAEQQAFENQLKLMALRKSSGGGSSSGGYEFSKLPELAKSKLSTSQINNLLINRDKNDTINFGEKLDSTDAKQRTQLVGNFINAWKSGMISQDDLQAGLFSEGINLNFGGQVSSATAYDSAKVDQFVEGLARLRMQGGTNEQIVTKAEELYNRRTISELEMIDILSRFGLM